MENVIVAPEVRDLDVLAGQLGGWLGARLAGDDIRIENLAYPFGAGQSHETILFDASWREGGRRHELGCVLRLKPRSHTVFPDDLFEAQHQVMKVLSDDGRVRVARPLWFEPDAALLGAPFFVMEKRRGRVPVSVPPYRDTGWVFEATPDQRRKLWENGVRQLAAIQRVPLSAFDFLQGPNGVHGLDQEWDKYMRFTAWMSRDRRWAPLDAAIERLRAAWPVNQPPGVVWGDARLGNMMFDDDFEVVAVMDWEQPSLGGALQDLTWWLYICRLMHEATPERARLDGMGTREETIALWKQLTGVSTADLEWYEAFTTVKFACLGIRMAQLKGWPAPSEAQLAERLRPALEL